MNFHFMHHPKSINKDDGYQTLKFLWIKQKFLVKLLKLIFTQYFYKKKVFLLLENKIYTNE